MNWAALFIISFFFAVALCAPIISPQDDSQAAMSYRIVDGCTEVLPQPPDEETPLGTVIYHSASMGAVTLLHFDIMHSIVWGARSVLRFGLITALAAGLVGTLIGAVSGYAGGSLSTIAMRLTDAFLTFPVIAGVWLFRQIMEVSNMVFFDYTTISSTILPDSLFERIIYALGIDPVMLALILFSWMPYARMVNATIIRLKQTEYAMAARSLGMRNRRVIARHLIPNAIAPVVVLLARDIGAMVILQAAFAFIGVSGTAHSTAIPEWSRLLLLGRAWIIGPEGNPMVYWWTYLPVTIAFVLFGMGWNMLGDGLNSVFNPREVAKR
jgi:peptide/nickel transport system permease protein